MDKQALIKAMLEEWADKMWADTDDKVKEIVLRGWAKRKGLKLDRKNQSTRIRKVIRR